MHPAVFALIFASQRDGVLALRPGALGPGVTLGRSQSPAGSVSTAVGADGATLQAFGADVPRFVGAARRLLIEGARTNLLTGMALPVTQNVAVTGAAHTLSFFGAGSITLSGAATGTLNGTGANDRVSLTFTPSAGTLTLTVAGSVTRAQLEPGAFASSYVQASSGQATRFADLVSAPLSSLGIGPNGACTVLMSAVVSSLTTGNQWFIQIDDGSNSNRFAVLNLAAQNSLRLTTAANSINTANAMNFGGISRFGMTIDGAGTARAVLEAGAVVSVAGGPTGGLTTLRIGNAVGGNAAMFGEVGAVRVLPFALSAADLQAALAAWPF